MITIHNKQRGIPVDAILVICVDEIFSGMHKRKVVNGEYCYVTQSKFYKDRYSVWTLDGQRLSNTGYYKTRFKVVPK